MVDAPRQMPNTPPIEAEKLNFEFDLIVVSESLQNMCNKIQPNK